MTAKGEDTVVSTSGRISVRSGIGSGGIAATRPQVHPTALTQAEARRALNAHYLVAHPDTPQEKCEGMFLGFLGKPAMQRVPQDTMPAILNDNEEWLITDVYCDAPLCLEKVI